MSRSYSFFPPLSRRKITAHAVDAASRRRRGGAEVKSFHRRSVQAARRTEKKLIQSRGAAVDIAADEIRVVGLHLGGRTGTMRQHARGEARREALDLRGDLFGHVFVGCVRHVAVAPDGMFPRRRALRI